MKKVLFFSLLLALSVWTLMFVIKKKETAQAESEKVTIIESKSASMSSVQTSAPAEVAASDYRLRILSEPAGAAIWLESEQVGQTPLEIPVPADSKKLRLSLNGFEDYERQIPAAKDSEGDLVWKIQLKKDVKPLSVSFYPKEIGPFSVQIKAVPLQEFSDADTAATDVNAKFCRVVVKDKAWVRVVLGPYKNKKLAQVTLKSIKAKHPQAFVATRHQCLAKADNVIESDVDNDSEKTFPSQDLPTDDTQTLNK